MFNMQNPLIAPDAGAAPTGNVNKQLIDALMGQQAGLKNGGMPFLPPGAVPPGPSPGVSGAIPALGPASLLKKF